MAKDPAFLFYPGDYLQDTQGMSEGSQVAYDRIICKHMLNIPITQQQVNYFTKRLSEDEKTEVYSALKKVDGGFVIEWVAESISKRRAYSESRSKNRQGSHDKDMKTYVQHMVNEIEIVNKDVIRNTKEERAENFKQKVFSISGYPETMLKDFYDYWTESSEKGKLLRYEKEKVFDIKKRLATWESRSKTFKQQNNGQQGNSFDDRIRAI